MTHDLYYFTSLISCSRNSRIEGVTERNRDFTVGFRIRKTIEKGISSVVRETSASRTTRWPPKTAVWMEGSWTVLCFNSNMKSWEQQRERLWLTVMCLCVTVTRGGMFWWVFCFYLYFSGIFFSFIFISSLRDSYVFWSYSSPSSVFPEPPPSRCIQFCVFFFLWKPCQDQLLVLKYSQMSDLPLEHCRLTRSYAHRGKLALLEDNSCQKLLSSGWDFVPSSFLHAGI